MASKSSRGTPHYVIWWITTILTPLSAFAAPIAAAQMLSGVFTWHAPIADVVQGWDEHVGAPLHAALSWLLGSMHAAWPKENTDYLLVGALLFWGYIRADPRMIDRPENPVVEQDPTGAALFSGLVFLLYFTMFCAVWPVLFLTDAAYRILFPRSLERLRGASDVERSMTQAMLPQLKLSLLLPRKNAPLLLAPIAVFVGMAAANAFLA